MDVAPLDRALDYPYHRPAHSFALRPGRGSRRLPDEQVVALAEGRTPVVASGSNGAPRQLQRKFAGTDEPVLVLATGIVDHDAVFTAQVTTYGAVPAALHPSPGTTLQAHLTLLTDRQLARMDATEVVGVDYDRRPVDLDLTTTADLDRLAPVEAYLTRTGILHHGASPIALAAMPARGRTLPTWTQRQVLEWTAGLHGTTLPELVAAMVGDDAVRRGVEAVLREHTGVGRRQPIRSLASVPDQT